MTSPIVRMYATEQQARDAASKLAKAGFPDEFIVLVAQPPPRAKKKAPVVSESGGEEAVAAPPPPPPPPQLPSGLVAPNLAKAYSDGLKKGRSLVGVTAPFGSGVRATRILERFDPVDMDIAKIDQAAGRPAYMTWDVAAPMSSAVRLPPLLHGQPSPFSGLFGLGLLSNDRTFESKYAELTSPDWTLSSRLGLGLLSRNQKGRASLSGKSGSAWTSSLFFPMLTKDPTPFSSMLGMGFQTQPVQPGDPAPFSASVGMPTLSRGRSFLSRMFGELASSRFMLFGRNPLISNAAPLSSMIGQPLLSEDPAPLSSKIGQSLLSGEKAPLSSKLSLPLLSRNPTPLSSLLHLAPLSRYQ